MKWIILLGSMALMVGCCCNTVYYTPAYAPAVVTYKPVVSYRPVVVRPAVTPVVQPVTVYSYPVGPLDVTTTTIDFY
ncbi:hypothetical protein [Legionella cherrii]|uniref:Lipoprotein n=1 Tax=Legionella cherrii TaxID=28084 RepID=A0A0W0SGY5_9GAMM|nr:hypothetical protein [Legionella cherrii]KTC82688.1 hypothetical protein Lche_0368 [Legionella cherrii]VEB35501.1 Uncharacterised protein [Legionella cherrii]